MSFMMPGAGRLPSLLTTHNRPHAFWSRSQLSLPHGNLDHILDLLLGLGKVEAAPQRRRLFLVTTNVLAQLPARSRLEGRVTRFSFGNKSAKNQQPYGAC